MNPNRMEFSIGDIVTFGNDPMKWKCSAVEGPPGKEKWTFMPLPEKEIQHVNDVVSSASRCST